MYNKQDKPISLVFIAAVVIFLVGILYYLSIPADSKKILGKKTFEEQLRYGKLTENPAVTKNTNNPVAIPPVEIQESQVEAPETPPVQFQISQKKNYDKLLEELAQYPANSLHYVEIIVNKIVEYMGYPSDTVKVLSKDIDSGTGKVQGSYIAAYFDIPSGNVYVDTKVLYSLDSKQLIAILCHELDHFDKIAKTAKSMGYSQFVSFMESKDVTGINREFWSRASKYADTSNFDSKYYQDAFARMFSKRELDFTSSYYDFYKLSENMRNPLEINAYEISDYVENYYKIAKTEGQMRKMTKKFNDVDWAVYNFISSNPDIKNERIALFDYFFMQAVVSTYPELKRLMDDCISTKNGDLTLFWLAYEKKLPDFYMRGRRLDSASFSVIIDLLNKTEAYAKKGASDLETANALKYKVNTLVKNIVYPNAVKNINATASDYLKFIKDKKISLPKDELDFIMILLCIENDITSDNSYNISVSNLKSPEILTKIYPLIKKRSKFYYVYDNLEFKSEYERAKMQDSTITKQKLFEQMLNSHRLEIKT